MPGNDTPPGLAEDQAGAERPAHCNGLTVDVEDYFQVEAFAGVINRNDWEAQPRRVSRNTNRILDILAESGVKATLFMLGWIGQRHPELVRRIVDEGHEIASHGCDHYRAHLQSRAEFRADVRRSKAVLEDAAGAPVLGYRAPTFSVCYQTRWVHSVLAEEGFRYSSSVYPISHDLYGEPDAPRHPFCPLPGFVELPLTTVRLFGRNLPTAGGGYFRLLPYRLTRRALRQAGRQLSGPCIFYIHPWEIDPGQPRQAEASRLSRFRHYCNLDRTEGRLMRLLRDFKWDRLDRTFLNGASPPPLIEAWATARPPK